MKRNELPVEFHKNPFKDKKCLDRRKAELLESLYAEKDSIPEKTKNIPSSMYYGYFDRCETFSQF